MEEMLERLAQSAHSNTPVRGTASMDGVRVWDFDLSFPAESEHLRLPFRHFEVLFCQSGRMSVQWKDGSRIQLQAGEILFLSDLSQIQNFCWPERRMQGILVAVDAGQAGGSLRQLCASLGGLELNVSEVGRFMARQRGCAVLARTPWSDGIFKIVQTLAPDQRKQYCVLMSAELLYLLCCNDSALSWKALDTYYDRHQVERVQQVHAYLLAHLEEAITIEQLSSRFQLSSTVLKQCFRHLYGQSIRKYIQACRMRQAADLLRTTQRSILQIANAVGYESTSQFGLIFKRHYQMAPSTYRAKMSESDDFRPNPHAYKLDQAYSIEN